MNFHQKLGGDGGRRKGLGVDLTRLTPVIIRVLVLVGVRGRRDRSNSSRMAVSATDSTPLITISSGKQEETTMQASGEHTKACWDFVNSIKLHSFNKGNNSGKF